MSLEISNATVTVVCECSCGCKERVEDSPIQVEIETEDTTFDLLPYIEEMGFDIYDSNWLCRDCFAFAQERHG